MIQTYRPVPGDAWFDDAHGVLEAGTGRCGGRSEAIRGCERLSGGGPELSPPSGRLRMASGNGPSVKGTSHAADRHLDSQRPGSPQDRFTKGARAAGRPRPGRRCPGRVDPALPRPCGQRGPLPGGRGQDHPAPGPVPRLVHRRVRPRPGVGDHRAGGGRLARPPRRARHHRQGRPQRPDGAGHGEQPPGPPVGAVHLDRRPRPQGAAAARRPDQARRAAPAPGARTTGARRAADPHRQERPGPAGGLPPAHRPPPRLPGTRTPR
jgi:hypothetical protein